MAKVNLQYITILDPIINMVYHGEMIKVYSNDCFDVMFEDKLINFRKSYPVSLMIDDKYFECESTSITEFKGKKLSNMFPGFYFYHIKVKIIKTEEE